MKKYLFALILCVCMLCGSTYSNVPFLSIYDFNQDGIVNYPDLKVFAEGWLTSYNNIEFSALAKDWMKPTTLYAECHIPGYEVTIPLYYLGGGDFWNEDGDYVGKMWTWESRDGYSAVLTCFYLPTNGDPRGQADGITFNNMFSPLWEGPWSGWGGAGNTWATTIYGFELWGVGYVDIIVEGQQ